MNASQKLLTHASDAVFNIDPETLKHILAIAHFGLADIQYLGEITRCWEIVLNHLKKLWPESMFTVLGRRIAMNRSIRRQLQQVQRTGLDYVDFSGLADKPRGQGKDEVFRRFFAATPRDLHDEGFWETDLKLYLAADRSSLARMEYLLRIGANPRQDVPFMTDNCYNVVDSRTLVLIARLRPVLEGTGHMDCNIENCDTLYQLAGSFRMRDILEKNDRYDD